MGKGSGFLRETCPSVVADPQCSSELEDEDMKRKKGLSREHCSAWNRPHGQWSLHSCFPAYEMLPSHSVVKGARSASVSC